MVSGIVQSLKGLGPWVLIPVFVYLVLESSIFLGLILPGEAIVVFTGAMAGQGFVSLAAAMPIVILATITGDIAGYFVGLHYGESMLSMSPWLRRRYYRHESRIRAHLERRGVVTVLVARISGMGQAFVPFICGLSRVRPSHFIAMTTIAESLWAGSLCTAGYMLGRHWTIVDSWLAPIGGGVVVVFVLTLLALALWHWNESRHTP